MQKVRLAVALAAALLVAGLASWKAEAPAPIKYELKKAAAEYTADREKEDEVVEAIDVLARRQFRTRSNSIRQGVLKELEAHGLYAA